MKLLFSIYQLHVKGASAKLERIKSAHLVLNQCLKDIEKHNIQEIALKSKEMVEILTKIDDNFAKSQKNLIHISHVGSRAFWESHFHNDTATWSLFKSALRATIVVE